MKNLENKYIKLSKKAEKCITRKKAIKVLKKYAKTQAASHDASGSDDSCVSSGRRETDV